MFLSGLGIGTFAFAFSLMAAGEGIGELGLGAAFSGYFFAKLLLAPVAGTLADRIGPRPVLIWAGLLGLGFPLGYFAFPQPSALYGIQFGLGLCGGILKPVGMAAIGKYSRPARQGRGFAWYNLSFYLALMSGPLLGGLLHQPGDPVPVMAGLISCMAGSLLLLLALPREMDLAMPGFGDASAKGRPPSGREFFCLLAAVGGRTAGIAITVSFYPLLLAERLGAKGVWLGLLFALPNLTNCLGLPLTGRMADRLDKRLLTLVGMLLCAGGLFFMGRVHSLYGFIAMGLVLGLGSVISLPASMSLAAGFSRAHQGRIMGIFQAVANLGFILGPILAGYAVQTAGTEGAFLLAGGLGILSCLPLGLRLLMQGLRQLPLLSFGTCLFSSRR